jgi:hypothetical protein
MDRDKTGSFYNRKAFNNLMIKKSWKEMDFFSNTDKKEAVKNLTASEF